MTNAIYCFDFTAWGVDGFAFTDVASRLAEKCKKFVFQLELAPTTNRKHWQGRISLTVKKRLSEVKELFDGPFASCRWSPTSQKGKGTFDYVMKADTRIEGPWNDANWRPRVMPAELKELKKLHPWQQFIVDDCKNKDEVKRIINVVIDSTGGQGKGFLRKYLWYHGLAQTVPPTSETSTIMAWAMAFPSRAYIVDMPRGTGMKRDIVEMWRGLESLKDGVAYEKRYKPQETQFEYAPHIWVMTNEKPTYTTENRYQFWLIDPEDQTMLPYDDEAAAGIEAWNRAKAEYLKAERRKAEEAKAMDAKVAKWRKRPKFVPPPAPGPVAPAAPMVL